MENKILLADEAIVIDKGPQDVYCDGKLVPLSGRLYNFFLYLGERADLYVSQEELAVQRWGDNGPAAENSVQVALHQTRRSFGAEKFSSPSKGVLRSHRILGIVAVTSLVGNRSLWNAEKHEILGFYGGRLAVNRTTQLVRDGEREVELTPMEFALFNQMIKRAGKTISGNMLCTFLESIGGSGSSASVATHMSSIRRRLGEEWGNKETGVIRTEPDRGYRFIAEPD